MNPENPTWRCGEPFLTTSRSVVYLRSLRVASRSQKEIRNVLLPHPAVLVLRSTRLFHNNRRSCSKHRGEGSAGTRCSRARHGRQLSRRRADVSEHLKVHSIRSEGKGRAVRLGERAMHSRALSVSPRRIHEGCSRRDGAPQRHGGGLRRSQERAEVERRRP